MVWFVVVCRFMFAVFGCSPLCAKVAFVEVACVCMSTHAMVRVTSTSGLSEKGCGEDAWVSWSSWEAELR